VPVGCVFVRDGCIIAKARNRTNELRNARYFILGIHIPFPLTAVPFPTGHQTCRARGYRQHSVKPAPTSRPSGNGISTMRHDTVCDCRTVHNVRIGVATTWHQRGLLRVLKRAIWRLWECSGCEQRVSGSHVVLVVPLRRRLLLFQACITLHTPDTSQRAGIVGMKPS
jgi:hypothetical protein